MATADFSQAELQQAFHACRIVRLTLDEALAHRALAIAIRHMAECQRRRSAQISAQRFDAKRAQANDND